MTILGISGGIGHDSSACIVRDGEVLYAAEEERFTRNKRASRTPPVLSTLFCLQEAGIDINEIDRLAIAWNPSKFNIRWPMDYLKEYLENPLLKRDKPFEVVPVDHHISHLVSSYACSGFEKATGIIIDGQGEDCSTTIAYINNRKIKIIEQKPISQSLGYYYQGVLRYLNLGRTESGKLMGLAGYGENKYDLPFTFDSEGYHVPIIDKDYQYVEENNDYVISWWINWFEGQFGKAAAGDIEINPTRGRITKRVSFNRLNHDLAASAQYYVEQAILATIKRGIHLTNCKNVVYGGGVALNCSANRKIMESGIIDDISVFSASGDSGAGIGAALFVDGTYKIKKKAFNAYLGPKFLDHEIINIVKKLNINYTIENDIEKKGSEFLANGKIIGWFQDRMEVGPRALGARSILADPSNKKNLLYINNEVKYRESWRPLSPSILAEYAEKYVQNFHESENMLFAFKAKEVMSEIMGATIHIDDTTRVQTVPENGSRYRRLIESFYKKTGIPGLLNTSFNLDGEPIVCTPIDAIRTFYSSNLDCLILGNVIIRKNN